jgi:hypothetical protein
MHYGFFKAESGFRKLESGKDFLKGVGGAA